jgi:hypothetical protein
VVTAGTSLPNSTDPTLVLDTCYPPDALFLTSKRLVVNAVETAARSNGARTDDSSSTSTVPSATSYSVPAPPALVAEGLTLERNEVPMGTLTLSGRTTPTFEQSPGPLDLEAAALEAYFGGIHSAEQSEGAWWAAIAGPGVPMPAELSGASISGDDAPLNVEIVSTRGSATAVVLTTTLTVSGGGAPGTYAESARLGVAGKTVTIAGWSMTPEASA